MFNGKEEVPGDITFNVQFADDRPTAAALSEDLRVRSQNDAEERLLGRHARRGNPQRDAGGVPLAADDRAEEPRRIDAGRARPSSPTRRAANAGTWTN